MGESGDLPPGWTEHFAKEQNRSYFYNAITKESVWVRPTIAKIVSETSTTPKENNTVTNNGVKTNENNKRPLEAVSTTVSPTEEKRIKVSNDIPPRVDFKQKTQLEKKDTSDELSAEQLRREFTSADMVMNANSMDLVGQYLKKFGSTTNKTNAKHQSEKAVGEVVELLSNSYLGYGKLCNLVSEWLISIPPEYRDNAFEIVSDPEIDPTEQFLMHHMKSLIVQKFNPSHVANEISNDTPPEWIKAMLQYKNWRHLIVILAGRHKDVPLLDFAIKAMSEAGFHEEVAQVPNASTFFTVFKSILGDILTRFATHDDSTSENNSLLKWLRELQHLCGYSQYTYLFTVDMLSFLEGSTELDDETKNMVQRFPEGLRSLFKRLKQEIVNDTKKPEKQALLQILDPMNRAAIGHSKDVDAEINEILKQVLEHKMFTAEQLESLKNHFDFKVNTSPPLWVIRQHNVISTLIWQLFQPFKPIPANMRSNGSYLLAIASAYTDKEVKEGEERIDVDSLYKAIMDALQVCNNEQTVSQGLEQDSAGIVLLSNLMKEHPLISAGALTWVLVCINSPKFINGSSFVTGFPTLLYLVRTAARCHPLQRGQAFFVIKSCFNVNSRATASTQKNAFRRTLLNELIYIMQLGYTIPVLKFVTMISNKQQGFDFSLLRHFIGKFVKTAHPPFSRRFSETSLLMLDSTNCNKAVCSNGSLAKEVSVFRAHCMKYANLHLNGTTSGNDKNTNSGAVKKPIELVKLVPYQS